MIRRPPTAIELQQADFEDLRDLRRLAKVDGNAGNDTDAKNNYDARASEGRSVDTDGNGNGSGSGNGNGQPGGAQGAGNGMPDSRADRMAMSVADRIGL